MNRASQTAIFLACILIAGFLTFPFGASGQVPARAAGLAISLRLSSTAYGVGELVVIQLRLTNETAAPVIMRFSRGRQYELFITTASRRIWTLARSNVRVEQTLVIGPRQTVAFEEVWNQRSDQGQPVGPGVYALSGRLLGFVSNGAAMQFSGVQIRTTGGRPTTGQSPAGRPSLGEAVVRPVELATVLFTIRR